MVIVMITTFCVTLSLLLTINVAPLHTHQLQASHELELHEHQLEYPALPRKLMINEMVADYEAKNLVSSNEQKKAFSGESEKKGEEEEVVVHDVIAARGTRQEWIEGFDPTHFFTMDYSHVRRRRPIHNKSFRQTVNTSP